MSVGRDFIGPFQLLRMIQAGTTAAVWEAIRTGESERIALKVLMKDFRKDKQQIAQLKREAEIGIALDHPNVIKIFEYHDEQGFPLIAMELFPARNLKIVMRENPEIIIPNISPIIRRCAKGLGHMHDKGWVHCDVKPDNFLVDEKVKVKLIDFSIGQKLKSGVLSSLFGAKTKAIQGTRSYMSPEQIRQKQPDQRSDIYGLGCMIYEMLAGKLPFTGNSPDELLQKHLKSKAPSLEAFSSVTPEFANIVKKMLEKKPENRFQSIIEFLAMFKQTSMYKSGKRPEGFKR